ncbi:molecular chaperone [Serratia fonticola]|uniref:molecular chaperone n=1 Tax=Serratia fonticola TaxID=47917 RepID=UPI0034C64BF6
MTKNWFIPLAFSLLLIGTAAQAAAPGGITVGGTRLIYDGAKKEASLSVTNSSSAPYLIQSWVEPLSGSTEKPPFIITPPLFRLDGNQQNLLRIVRTGGNLPENRESMYWLNIKSIPSSEKTDGANTLQIAVKTSIKLIYRPQGLKETPEAVTDKLTWSQSGNRLTVNNPTPYYMNFNQVKVGGREVKDVTFVAPMSSSTFVVPAGAAGPVSWKLITDFGGVGAEHVSTR